MKEDAPDGGERGEEDGPERGRDGRASRYYYDDATGYEVFNPDEEEGEEGAGSGGGSESV